MIDYQNFFDELETTTRFQSIRSKKSKRTAFDRDFDRIIFSYPFRKLQDKTQVHPLPEQDFVHNRLTHSLEVSSVGRSLGKATGEKLLIKYPELNQEISSHDFGVITASASLAHDIGNPPLVIQVKMLFQITL